MHRGPQGWGPGQRPQASRTPGIHGGSGFMLNRAEPRRDPSPILSRNRAASRRIHRTSEEIPDADLCRHELGPGTRIARGFSLDPAVHASIYGPASWNRRSRGSRWRWVRRAGRTVAGRALLDYLADPVGLGLKPPWDGREELDEEDPHVGTPVSRQGRRQKAETSSSPEDREARCWQPKKT